jgi:hypothetical protein
MPTYQFVRYDINGISLGGTTLHGVQSVTLGRSLETTTIVKKGAPSVVKNWYKKPSVTISFTRFLTSSIFTSYSLAVASGPPQTSDIVVSVIDIGGVKVRDCRLKSLTFNLTNEGNFTESVTYEGVTFESDTVTSFATPEYGTVLRRQDFAFGSLPSQVSGKHILSAEASLNINYGQVPTWGQFYTNFSSYISVPVDVSCSFEVLETGFPSYISDAITTNSHNAYDSTTIDDSKSISIDSGGPVINLGSRNFLSNVERTGGDVGGSYAVYKYTYRNTNNYFTVS